MVKGLGAIKRFGVRYGRTVKERLAKVEMEQKARRRCPYCTYEQVTQQGVGIFVCKKCGAKFASRAYSTAKPARVER